MLEREWYGKPGNAEDDALLAELMDTTKPLRDTLAGDDGRAQRVVRRTWRRGDENKPWHLSVCAMTEAELDEWRRVPSRD